MKFTYLWCALALASSVGASKAGAAEISCKRRNCDREETFELRETGATHTFKFKLSGSPLVSGNFRDFLKAKFNIASTHDTYLLEYSIPKEMNSFCRFSQDASGPFLCAYSDSHPPLELTLVNTRTGLQQKLSENYMITTLNNVVTKTADARLERHEVELQAGYMNTAVRFQARFAPADCKVQ